MHRRLWSLATMAAAIPNIAPIGAALAQQVAEAPSNQLETVIVTANKRSEDVKDVPTSISVLGGNELADQHIESYDDITRAVPGVSFNAGGGVGQENLEIRGISSTVGAATVGLYLNDTPLTLLNQAGTAQPQIIDLDRIEVLRGPQGTLYGASSEGGTIRFITKQPDLDTLSADITSDLSGTLNGGNVNYDEKAIVNIPIIEDVLAIRADAEYGDQSGWINKYQHAGGELLATNPGEALLTPTSKLLTPANNDLRADVFKLTALLKLDDLSITPSIYFQHQHQADAPDYILGAGQFQDTRPEAEFTTDDMWIPSLTIDKGLGFATLTSISSMFYRQTVRNADGTYYDPDVVVPDYIDTAVNSSGGPLFTPHQIKEANLILATLPNNSRDQERNEVTTQEFRFTSTPPAEGGLPFKWVAGFYFSNDTDRLNHYEQAEGWVNDFENIFGYNPSALYTNTGQLNPISSVAGSSGASPLNPHLWDDNEFDYFISKRGERDYAAYGQADFDILPDLHASAGIRYQVSQLTYQVNEGAWWNLGIPPNGASSSTDYALNPKFSLKYDIDDTTNVYATAAKGYRVGGSNDPVPPGLCGPYYKLLGITAEPAGYGPDKLWSYELGTKARLFDNSLSIDADVYDIQWTNVQQQILIPVCFFGYVTNVGDANAYGSELQLRYKVHGVPGLVLNFSGNVQHAVVTSSSNPNAAAVGQKLLFAPDWTASGGFSYSQPINDDITGFIRMDYDWTGRSNGDFERDASDYSNKQYGVLNGSIGVQMEDLEVSLYAKNMTDNLVVIKSPNVAGVTDAYTLTPVTVGLVATKHFTVPHASPEPAPEPAAPPPVEAPPAPPAKGPELSREFQVFFDFDKSDITEAAASVIAKAAEAVKAGNIVKLTVTGHTDTVGSAKYNLALSERRAAAVKAALVTDGVAGGEITTIGVGKTGLLVPTADGVREPQNRRAVIELQ